MNGDGNFKMKCIEKREEDYTEGKIYEVTNGIWFTNGGGIVGEYENIKNIDDANEFSNAEWELVEENPVKERMAQVAKMLGVEIGEEFNIIEDGEQLYYCPYKFTEKGLVGKYNNIWDKRLSELIRGICKVEKLPWKPKDKEVVYSMLDNHTIFPIEFDCTSTTYVALYKCGWLFRTEKEAEANKERVIKEMREVIG